MLQERLVSQPLRSSTYSGLIAIGEGSWLAPAIYFFLGGCVWGGGDNKAIYAVSLAAYNHPAVRG